MEFINIIVDKCFDKDKSLKENIITNILSEDGFMYKKGFDLLPEESQPALYSLPLKKPFHHPCLGNSNADPKSPLSPQLHQWKLPHFSWHSNHRLPA